jgi:hypothetical protein
MACVVDAKRAGFAGDVDPATGLFTGNRYTMARLDDGIVRLEPLQPRPQ